MTDAPLRLYAAPDNASLIVRLALEELGLPYETRRAAGHSAEARGAEYRALAPTGLVPALETPEGPLFETGAILLWLADRAGTLAPRPDAPERGIFLSHLFFTSNTLHADLRRLFYPTHHIGPAPEAQAHLRRITEAALRRHLALLDRTAERAPTWLAPEEPSVLGYYIACILRWLALYPRDGRGWYDPADAPALARLAAAYERHPAARRAAEAEGIPGALFTAPEEPTTPYDSEG